jgi:hypothetical protein
LSKAISAAAKAAADAATAIGKLSAPMTQGESDEEEERRKELALAKIDELREKNKQNIPDSESLAEEVKKNINQTIKDIIKMVSDYDSLIELVKTAKTLDDLTKATEKNETNKEYLNRITEGNDRKLANIKDDAIVKLYEETINNARSKLEEFTEVSNIKLAELKAKVATDDNAQSDLAKSASAVVASISGAVNAIQSLEKEAAAEVASEPEAQVEEGADELKLKTNTPESIQGIMNNMEPFILQNDFESLATELSPDALEIIGRQKQSGGGVLGKNREVISDANQYIDTFKANTSKLLNNPIFLKLSSLSTDQLSDIFNASALVRDTDTGKTLTPIEKKTLLSCIVNFLYIDFTFCVLLTDNMQYLLLGNTFDNYKELGPTKDNRRNYLELLDQSERDKLPNMYGDFEKFIKLKNVKINADLSVEKKVNPEIAEQRRKQLAIYKKNNGKYKYVGLDNKEQMPDQPTQIRIGELTIYIKEFLELISNFQKNIAITIGREGNPELPKGSYDMYDILIKYIKGKEEQLNQINKTIYPIITDYNKVVFVKKLEEFISDNSTNNIITYLKLRNDDSSSKRYNKRFQIGINDKDKSLLVKYRNDNFPFYNTDDLSVYSKLNDKIKNNLTHDGIKLTSKLLDITYKDNYQFGKFSDIFMPDVTNSGIADSMSTIKDKILKGVPVFMLGYGASGAGKTSSLIYFNKGQPTQKDGILIHLCNQLSKYGFNKLEMCSREFFHVNVKTQGEILKKLDEPEIVYAPKDQDIRINFELKAGPKESKFVLADDYEHENHHQYRVLTKRTGKTTRDVIATIDYNDNATYKTIDDNTTFQSKPDDALIVKHVFEKGTSIGAVAIHLIDTDRFVKATTNNPNSSRSHTLIFVKLKRDNGSDGNIIIGDFAGVENAFACENPSTIGKFLSVLREPNGNEPQSSYYSTESYNGDPDPYGKLNTDVKGGTVSETCKPLISITDPIYNFKDPVVRQSWELDQTVKDFCTTNIPVFAKAIGIIRKYIGTDGLSPYTEVNINSRYTDDKIKSLIDRFGIYSEINSQSKPLTNSQKSKLESEKQAILESDTNLTVYYVESEEFKYKTTGFDIGRINISGKNLTTIGRALEGLNGEINTDIKMNVNPEWNIIQTVLNNVMFDIKKANAIINKTFEETKNKNIKELNIPYIKYEVLKTSMQGTASAAINQIKSIIENKIKTIIDALSSLRNNIKIIKASMKKDIANKDEMINQLGEINKANNAAIDKIVKGTGVSDDADVRNIFAKIISNIQFIKYIQQVEIEKSCREGNSGVICENRREEGYFINDSLSKVRDVISKILYEKNKDKVNISPKFIDECLKKYCSSDEGCFKFDRLKDESYDATGSVIFDEIYKVLSNSDAKYKTVQDLYKDIIVSVFCVFNISRVANNPPPVPYMDINDLKRKFFSGISAESDYTEVKTLGNKIIRMIEDTCNTDDLTNPEGFGDKVSNLKTIKSKSFAQPGKRATLDKLKNIDGTLIDTSIFEEFKHILNEVEFNELIDNYYNDAMYETRIRDFIDMIDKSNAVSAIGTLEFLDKIAKYNATQTICNNIEESQLSSQYVEIYDSIKKGGGNTKRHKPKPKKNQTTTLKSYSR